MDLAAIRARIAQLDADLEAAPVPMTGAERIAAMRARDRDAGINREAGRKRDRRQKYNPARNLFTKGAFIAIDGEGVTEGDTDLYKVKGINGRQQSYTAAPHYMMLLAASTGAELVAHEGRLGAQACLDFLLGVAAGNPDSIMVCYGGSYDVNQMLLYDLPYPVLQAISKGARVSFVMGGQAYELEYRPRKCLRVWRYPGDQIEWLVKGDSLVKEPPQARFVLWDVIGFFQSSFAEAMTKWLGQDHADLELIRTMKAQRGEFARADLAAMQVYNQAECRALVAIMDRLRSAVEGLGLTLQRWDGAGAIAAAMNKLHSVKEHRSDTPPDVFHAARCAFSGGHIEVCRIGTFPNTVHHYDVNSAYPAEIENLPSLDGATWEAGEGFDPPPGFTLVHVRYEFEPGMPFYPLFFRTIDGCIIYPQCGEGWYWWPEFDAARDFFIQFGGTVFQVLGYYRCVPASTEKPFAFVRAYYDQRKQMVQAEKEGKLTRENLWWAGAEKVIKLGINSLYGKTAQQLGARRALIDGEWADVLPPYFQLEWAGYVTAGCRAKLMRAAMQDPHAIISFATDGLFSMRPLKLDCPREKILGAWEYQRHAGMVVAMPGVYWLLEGGDQWRGYSRGFDKGAMSTPERIERQWKLRRMYADVPMLRLATMGSACTADAPGAASWRARGRFLAGFRRLDISGSSSKRNLPAYVKNPPLLSRANALTPPRDNFRYLEWLADGEPLDDPRSSSAPYAVRWLDAAEPDDIETNFGAIEAWEELDADDSLW